MHKSNNTPQLMRGMAIFMATLAALFLLALAGGAAMAQSTHSNAGPNSAYYAPADDGTPEGTETRHPEGTETAHPEATETEQPHATGTREVEPTETHEVEPTETEHPNGTRTPEGTETREVEPSETAHPEATETEQPHATGTPSVEPTETENPSSDDVPGTGARVFPQTGKTVKGVFLQYWDRNGGVMQQGYPISEPRSEKSALDGKTYTVQYFERAVFESHPENAAPYNVLLSQLGTFQYKAKYPNGAPNQVANTANGRYFPETKHWVGGVFLKYWQEHGGLMQQGFPISDQFQEKSALDGKTYTVQYFERAVFESHPENAAPYNVLLSQLGTYRYQQGGR